MPVGWLMLVPVIAGIAAAAAVGTTPTATAAITGIPTVA